MYTLRNSVQDMLQDGLVERGFYLFCPEPFVQMLTEAANRLLQIERDDSLQMTPGN